MLTKNTAALRLCLFVFSLFALGTFAGCKQAEGDRCQLDEDCGDGLYCELAGNTRAQGGFCKAVGSSSAPIDLSTDQTPQG